MCVQKYLHKNTSKAPLIKKIIWNHFDCFYNILSFAIHNITIETKKWHFHRCPFNDLHITNSGIFVWGNDKPRHWRVFVSIHQGITSVLHVRVFNIFDWTYHLMNISSIWLNKTAQYFRVVLISNSNLWTLNFLFV